MKPKNPLTEKERSVLTKALAFLGLGLIADDILDFIDERRRKVV